MTTIAWDGKTLAADSQRTSSDTVETNGVTKIFKDVGQFKLAAICGDLLKSTQILNWVRSIGAKEDFPISDSDCNTCVICIDFTGDVFAFRADAKGAILEFGKGIYADGSGWQLALGAMEAGASSTQAVEIACKRDIYTGGEVLSYRLSDVE